MTSLWKNPPKIKTDFKAGCTVPALLVAWNYTVLGRGNKYI